MSFLSPINLLIFLLINYCLAAEKRYVSVSTSKGTVQGTRMDYGNDPSQLYYGQANCFLGIPYAQPPTGERRFMEPQPNFMNGVHDATYLRGQCPQPGQTSGQISEDCLYLNIFTNNIGNQTLAAVMVFVSGQDGFSRGGADRAEIPGFMAAPAGGIPPNLGMHDQVMALTWIQSEIKNFGGDPNRVTLCGHADGACAVSALTYSPMANNLFQQAILQSGSIYSCYEDRPQTGPMGMQTLNYDPGMPQIPLNGGGQGDYQGQGQGQGNFQGSANQGQGGFQGSGQGQGNFQGQGFQQQSGGFPQGGQMNNNMFGGGNQQGGQWGDSMDPSQQVAMQLCNITAQQWRSGDLGNLRPCLQSLSVDVFIQMQGRRQSKWLVVRDNSFLPGSLDQLGSSRPRIPMILGTVQDEDADYAFKLIADGKAAGKSEQDLFNGWFVDFAKKNKISGQQANDIRNIIANNYNVTGGGQRGNFNSNNFNNNGGMQGGGFNQNNNFNNQNGGMAPYQEGAGHTQGSQRDFTDLQVTKYNNPNGVSQQTIEALKVITRISSDANGISQSVSQITAVQASGSQVLVYQFTHVSDLGRQQLPSLGAWKPIYRGQDQTFLFMTETIWSQGRPTPTDFRVANDMGSRWTDFAKNGQVNGWQPTNPSQYNYCNLNAQPRMQPNYASDARRVFNDQVYPRIQQAENANVMIHSEDGPDSWSISFSIPYMDQSNNGRKK